MARDPHGPTRVCPSCKRELPNTFEHFSRRYKGAKTLDSWCRGCRRRKRSEWGARQGREVLARRGRERRMALRLRVLTHYGGDPPACACCGESHIEFLALDHVDGGGRLHRSKVGRGQSFYVWIEKHGYPEGFRVLCHNCNAALGHYGYCPHDVEVGGLNHGSAHGV